MMSRAVKKKSDRRSILFIGWALLFYPLFKFLTHRIPQKPKRLELPFDRASRSFLSHEKFFVFSSPTEVWAVSRKCTHLGCKLHYREQEHYLECPCHQSRFTTSGEVLQGPAAQQLKTYQVTQNAENASITVIIQ